MAQSNGAQNDVYRPLPESDLADKQGTRHSEGDADGAGEKLLKKDEARIVSADMPDAKYKAGHPNGEAKIEIDSNKRMFTGLTKEELLKYQDDPFWVRLRWSMFVLFWTMWLCMLAGAIAIIVRSPKCTASSVWYKQGPLLDLTDVESYQSVAERLPLVREAGVTGVIVAGSLAGELYDDNTNLTEFSELAASAKQHSVKIIVEIMANNISTSHPWFAKSERSEDNFTDFLTWAPAKTGANREPPNNWVSMENTPAWGWSETRQAFFLQQHSVGSADLNFGSQRVIERFADVLRRWLSAGASGIRLKSAQTLLVDASLKDDAAGAPSASSHAEYEYYSHRATAHRPELEKLFREWRSAVEAFDKDALLFMSGGALSREPYVGAGGPTLALPPAGAVSALETAVRLKEHLSRLLPYWPAIEISGTDAAARELVMFALLLPATPVLSWTQLYAAAPNNTWQVQPTLPQVLPVRAAPPGPASLTTLRNNSILAAFTEWGDSRYVGIYNPSQESVVGLPDSAIPESLLTLDNTTVEVMKMELPPLSTKVFKIAKKMEKASE